MKSELKVGIFVFIGILFLFFLTTQVGTFKNLSKEGYTLYADLDNAAGLEENSKVKANGIDVGFVKSLNIVGNKIRLNMFIYKGIKLPADSELQAMQSSMLGGKYVAINLGTDETLLDNGSVIKSKKELATITEASDSMASAADEFKAFISEFREIMDTNAREDLKHTFSNLEVITDELKKFTQLGSLQKTADNFNLMAIGLSETSFKFSRSADMINAKLPQIMANLDQVMKDLRASTVHLKNKIPDLADKFRKIGDDLDNIISENRAPLNNTLVSADSFFSTGDETFTKIDDLLTMVDKVKLEVGMHTEWMSSDEYAKGYLNLNYIPSDTKQYQFSVVGMDDYSNMDDDGKLIAPRDHEESNILFSAQLVKRFDSVALRAGLIESTVGAGIDYFMFNDKLKTSAQIYDFSMEEDIRNENPHAKIGARYTLLKHLDLFGGYDNFLNSDADNAYIGLGVRFFDDDLKKLIMTQSLGSMAK